MGRIDSQRRPGRPKGPNPPRTGACQTGNRVPDTITGGGCGLCRISESMWTTLDDIPKRPTQRPSRRRRQPNGLGADSEILHAFHAPTTISISISLIKDYSSGARNSLTDNSLHGPAQHLFRLSRTVLFPILFERTSRPETWIDSRPRRRLGSSTRLSSIFIAVKIGEPRGGGKCTGTGSDGNQGPVHRPRPKPTPTERRAWEGARRRHEVLSRAE